MNIILLKALIEKKLITAKTEFDAEVKIKIFSQEQLIIENHHFAIKKMIENSDDNISFDCYSTISGKREIINVSQITNIDGMTPERYAAVFNLDENGTYVPEEHKKRGPKKKEDMA